MAEKSILIALVTRLCHLIYMGLSHVAILQRPKHSQEADMKSCAPKYVSVLFGCVFGVSISMYAWKFQEPSLSFSKDTTV